WCGNNSFGELFPNLFAKELRQNSLRANRMINNRERLSWRWEWRDALSQSEEQELIELKELMLV
ncbi:hypothetical protein A2U01_0071437, partial [Trifolium medium]|nr:hypothetical protein [Trifolium medium]